MKLLDIARKRDVVIVWKLDRLARSLRQLIDTTVLLNEHGVELHSHSEGKAHIAAVWGVQQSAGR